MNNRLVAALLLSLTTLCAQDFETPFRRKSDETLQGVTRSNRTIQHVSRPLPGVVSGENLISNGLRALAAVATVPTWNATSGNYNYQMFGNNPMVAQATQTTTIATPIVPLILKFADGNTFDPTASSTCSAQAPVSLTLSSPVFGSTAYAPNGTSVGNTQYVDFFQRASFWKYTGPTGINPNYHVLLAGSAAAAITVTVPAASGVTAAAPCGRLGEMDINWFDNYLMSTIFPQLATAGILPSQFPIFLIANVVMYETTTNNCCILGYHSAFYNPSFSSAIQTYAVADFDTSRSFGTSSDVEPLSHEVAEWMDDPLGNNPTPVWGHIGQVSGCQANLEVGDPLSGTVQTITMSNAYTYHVQEMAFVSWFYKDSPSLGVNGWYSSNGTFKTPATACNASSTSLSISPTTMAVGSSAAVTIKVAASGTIGTATGKVTLTTSTGVAIGTYTLTTGAYSGSIAFPAGSYKVNANYAGDLNFGPSSSAAITVNVGSPSVTLSPISLSFPGTTVGVASAAQTVTLSNKGTAILASISISLAGASPADYSQSNNCGTSVAVNASCTIAITFKPTTIGTRTATLRIADNAAGSPQSLPLTGSALAIPVAKSTLSVSSLSFGSVTVGASSTVRNVTLTNSGTASLIGIAISRAGSYPDDYSYTTTCATSLAASSSCTVSVIFKPVAAGTRNATVNVITALSTTPQTVSLSGTGVAPVPVVTLSATSLSFASTSVGTATAAQVVTVRNTGAASLTITGITLSGSAPADYSKSTTCTASLDVGSSCTVSVIFKPTAKGTRAAALNISHNATGSPQQVSLTGPGK